MLEIILSILAILLLLPVVVIFIQVISARFLRSRNEQAHVSIASMAVLVPAHNEEDVIEKTVVNLLSQLSKNDAFFVIADNCQDNTAGVAQDLGAQVLVRDDPVHKGKGYALDYALQYLTQKDESYDVVLVIDADCVISAGNVQDIKAKCMELGRPVQVLDLMHNSGSSVSLKQKIAEFAWIVKNWVRPLGAHKLGWPCQLMGTGMAFPWRLIKQMNIASGNIVEDMKLGIDLTLAGFPPHFYPGVTVSSYFPEHEHAVKTQRTRWEHGHLQTIIFETPKLLWTGLYRLDMRLVALGLDLLVPPLAFLVLLMAFMFILAALAYWLWGYLLPLTVIMAGFILMVTAVLLAWSGWGRHVISLKEFLSVPFYIFSKLPIYLNLVTNKQKKWVKTSRDGKVGQSDE